MTKFRAFFFIAQQATRNEKKNKIEWWVWKKNPYQNEKHDGKWEMKCSASMHSVEWKRKQQKTFNWSRTLYKHVFINDTV